MHFYVPPDAFFEPTDKPWVELTRLTVNRDGRKVGHKAQHRTNKAWAERNGFTIGAWYKEENVSTSDVSVSREVWERVLAEIEAGLWGGLIVWRADRLTRQTFQFTRLQDVARRQRALIAASYDSVTSIDPIGYRRLLDQVANAEQEVDTLTQRVIANSAERKRRGFYHGGGKRPWCFEAPRKNKADRVTNSGRVGVKHVAVEVALAKEAAQRVAWEDWSYKDVIEEWHSRTPPVYGATGAPWSTTTLRNSLTSPRMIGKVLVETTDSTGQKITKLRKAQWKPILERETWDRLCSLVKHEVHKEGVHRYLLTPILECGRCHLRLTGCVRAYKKQGAMVPTRTYRCKSHSSDKARGACGKLNVIAEPVEKLVRAFIFTRLGRTRELGFDAKKANDLQSQIAERSAEVDRLAGELKILVDHQASAARLPMAEYLIVRQGFDSDLEAAKVALASLLHQLDVPHPVGIEWEDLRDWFDRLTQGQQQKLVLAYVRKVVVLPPGRSGRYFKPERVVITAADAKEIDGNGDHGGIRDLDGDPLLSA